MLLFCVDPKVLMASLRRTLSSTTYQEQEGFVVLPSVVVSSCAIRVAPVQQQQQPQQQQQQKSCDLGSSPVSAAVVSQDFTPFLLALLGFGSSSSSSSNSSQGMGERVVVGKSTRGARSAWRRFPILLGMCFVVGLCAGIFTPYSWTPNTGQSFVSHFSEGIKVENMATSSGGAAVVVANALKETSGIGSKAREIVGVDAVVNESSIVLRSGCFFSSLSLFLSTSFGKM
jgi:hypothetical protein